MHKFHTYLPKESPRKQLSGDHCFDQVAAALKNGPKNVGHATVGYLFFGTPPNNIVWLLHAYQLFALITKQQQQQPPNLDHSCSYYNNKKPQCGWWRERVRERRTSARRRRKSLGPRVSRGCRCRWGMYPHSSIHMKSTRSAWWSLELVHLKKNSTMMNMNLILFLKYLYYLKFFW